MFVCTLASKIWEWHQLDKNGLVLFAVLSWWGIPEELWTRYRFESCTGSAKCSASER